LQNGIDVGDKPFRGGVVYNRISLWLFSSLRGVVGIISEIYIYGHGSCIIMYL
jgi:hypothetical protein